MPSMPPPGIGMAGSSFGISLTIASVVSSRPATDARSAARCATTLVGSMMPNRPCRRTRRWPRCSRSRPCLRRPCSAHGARPPALMTIWRSGSSSARRRMLIPTSWSSLSPLSFRAPFGPHQRDTTARDDAFFDGCTRGVQRVFDARLLLLHLDLGGRANLDHGNTAGQLGHALLQLLAIVVRGGLFDLALNLLDARLDVAGLAGTVDDGGVFLGDLDLLGLAQVARAWPSPGSDPLPRRSPGRPSAMAMSCSMALRRSPKPGALTAATFTMPRMLFTTSVARASPSTSSATISSGRPALATPRARQHVADVRDFLSCSRIAGFSSSHALRSAELMK